MRALILALMFVSPPFLKRTLLRMFCKGQIHPRAHVGWLSAVYAKRVVLGAHSSIGALSVIRLDGELQLGDYAQIASFNLIYGCSDLVIGEQSYLGPQSLVNADEPVRIGRDTGLAPRAMILTHGSWPPVTEGFRWRRMAPVTLGDQVWCAAGVFVNPGVTIGDGSVIASCAVVTKDVPPDTVVSGNPATVLFPVSRAKEALTTEGVDRRVEEMLEEYVRIGLDRELGITTVESTPGRIAFQHGSRRYEVRLRRSNAAEAEALVPAGTIAIVVNNQPGWTPPPKSLWFDLSARAAPFSSDPIHRSLRLFLRRYCGMRFRDALLERG